MSRPSVVAAGDILLAISMHRPASAQALQHWTPASVSAWMFELIPSSI